MSRHFVEQRLNWIRRSLIAIGHIQRSDLQVAFGISSAQASLDLREARTRWPDLVIYNRSSKRYERGTAPQEEEAMESAAEAPTETPSEDGWEWAIVEVFGHRRHAGRVREEEKFGAKFCRVDIPNEGDPVNKGWTTHLYPGSAIFSFTPCDEPTALKANKPYSAPSRYSLPAPEDAGDGGSEFDEELPY